jgi:hypothetical protein
LQRSLCVPTTNVSALVCKGLLRWVPSSMHLTSTTV